MTGEAKARYSAGSVDVADFDTLVLYSDGITEAASENEEFGDARVQQPEPIDQPVGAGDVEHDVQLFGDEQ